MEYPDVMIKLTDKGDKCEIFCHTIDPELEKIVGKDESEQFLQFKKEVLPMVLKVNNVRDTSELLDELKKEKSLYRFRKHLEMDNYGAGEKPVFLGHYWLKGKPAILKSNVFCLDYSVAKGGYLTAYRWYGEQVLSDSKLIWV